MAAQVAQFLPASHIVALHGAGLANLIFSSPGAQVVEIFPRSFGMPSLYVSSVTAGHSYATYIADKTIPSPVGSQFDDVEINVKRFIDMYRELL